MALFDEVKPEDLLLSVRNFQMMLEALGTLDASSNIQHLCTLLHGDGLREFDIFFAHVRSMNKTHLNRIILGLGRQFSPINK